MKYSFLLKLCFIIFFITDYSFPQDIAKEIKNLEKQLSKYKIDDSIKVDIYQKLAFKYINYDVEKSRKFAEAGIELSKMIGYDFGHAKCLSYLGLIHYRMGMYQKAIDYHLQALKKSEKINNIQEISYGYNNIANVYMEQKNFNLALENYNKSIYYKEIIKDTQGIATSYKNMALTYIDMRKFDSAFIYLEKALPLAKSVNDERIISHMYSYYADIYILQKKYSIAEKYLTDAAQVQNKLNDYFGLSRTLNVFAKMYLEKKDYKSAIKYYNRAYANSEKLNIQYEKSKSLFGLSESYKALGKYKESYEKYVEFDDLRDSISGLTVQTKIADLSSSYEIEKKKREIELLSKEAGIQEQKIFAMNIIILLSILFLLALSILLLLLYRNRKKLKIQSEEIKMANKTKDKLFSIIAHDLRNPIGNFMNNMQIIDEEKDNMPKELRDDFFREMRKNAEETYFLLDNLLNWAKDQSNNIILKKEKTDIKEIIEKNIAISSNIAVNKSITIISSIDKPTFGYFDTNTINIVLRNLISNSIKFTPQKGKIQISLIEKTNEHIITIEDTGIGIPEETLSNIFTNRNSISTLGTRGEVGTGLGLILCKDFVEKNDGRLWVESKPGIGSKFHFTIPTMK